MIKYKHIPSGRIYQKSKNISSDVMSYYDIGSESFPVPAFIVENGKDWEKINEEFTILSFKQESDIKDFWTEFPEGWGRNINGNLVTTPYTFEHLLKSNLYTIHSVKRNKDGVIFTIGDRCTSDIHEKFGNFNVTKFTLTSSGDSIVANGVGYQTSFNRLEKSKDLLFTTEDGVDIYDCDNNVNGKGKRLYQAALKAGTDCWNDDYEPYTMLILNDHGLRGTKERFITFSTEPLAREYILMNKPCLSVNDIKSLMQNQMIYLENVKDIVKERIKTK